MTEIKRWCKYGETYPGDDGQMFEDPQGEWVRWEDVKDLIDLARDAVTLKVFQEFGRDNDPTPP
jgi:hypothetical protein